MKVEIVHPSELGSSELSAWARLQADAPELGSPLLGSGFALAVGRVRPDARVAIWRDGRRAAGFLGFHRAAGGFARPIGAPLADYQALVSAPQFPPAGEALGQAGLHGMRLSGLIDPHRVFPDGLRQSPSHRIDLSAGGDAYLAELWAGSRNRWRNYKRYSRRLGEEIGLLRIRAPDRSPAAFDALLDWKRRQLTATGLHDFTASRWIRQLMDELFQARERSFGGLMITLYAGERPVAAHFGVRQDGWYHPWLGAYDPELAGYSPGLVHQVLAAAAAARVGVHTYDLGPHADRSKAMFANATAEVGEGVVTDGALAAVLVARSEEVLSEASGGGLLLIERARKRWDHIAAVEPSLGGRLVGLVRTAAALNRRIDAWSHAA